MHNDNVKTYT